MPATLRRIALCLIALAGMLGGSTTFADGTGGTAPKLTVTTPGPNQYRVTWPLYLAQSYRLQATTDLAVGPWTDVDMAAGLPGDVTVDSVAPQLFFRLRCDCVTGATDDPDGNFADIDCDGIDGVLSAAIYAAPDGIDDSARGLSPDQPVRSLQFAINQAVAKGRKAVYLQAGTYSGLVTMASGVSVYGGYDINWIRADRNAAGHTVTITGGFSSTEGNYLTVLAKGLANPVTIADVVIIGPSASTSAGSYGLVAINSSVTLARVTIQAGTGGNGGSGANGGNASQVDATTAMGGGAGGNALEQTRTCDSTARGAGGTAGTNSSVAGSNGGAGGGGGTMDTSCSFPPNTAATAGLGGADAASPNGTSGRGGPGSPPNVGQPGVGGTPGTIINGAAGGGGSGFDLIGNYPISRSGGSGSLGSRGGGGGGGGGSGGDDAGVDSYGAGGGGGGAGGAAAPSSASGGIGGGPSVGVYANGSTLVMTDCTIQRGTGGRGGNGGNGGRGQSGGLGGLGGLAAGGSMAGGNGGNGGHGGHGGGAGGGAGGASVGVLLHNTSAGNLTNVNYLGGGAGMGGSGGVSAPTAPVAERDGNNGAAGSPGTLATVLSF